MSTRAPVPPLLEVAGLEVGYGEHLVIRGLDLELPAGGVTTIVGPNGCGKSTLLRSLARIIPARNGRVRLLGRDVARTPRKELARIVALLPQQPIAPEGITVADLVARGRHPHQSWLQQWSTKDEAAVVGALQQMRVEQYADHPIDALSGGQRQRIWIAMVLAQDTEAVFLDEPTTYLDLSRSVEVLSLVRSLATEQRKSVIMVLHDLNLAIQYSDHLVVMGEGHIKAQGSPKEIITAELLERVFDLRAAVVTDPLNGGPLVVPKIANLQHVNLQAPRDVP